ncbi:MAG: transposase [Bacteroidales bacterium]|nr:transposase [Bacteroidales bacterium]MCF8455720.1 transposase [Bacteroidales bacterium]
MAYNPNIHHRRSIRLKGYDYSRAGLYFITICTQHMACLYGKIIDDEMILNDAGKMVEKWYHELENKFPDIECDEFVVMPNHFHCIIEKNTKSNVHVGATLCGCPIDERPIDERPIDARPIDARPIDGPTYGPDNKKYNATIGDTMDWFKTMTTNEYIRGVKTLGWKRFDKKLWHRNYWEHIIRDQKSYETISEYIRNNPKNWNRDKLNKA